MNKNVNIKIDQLMKDKGLLTKYKLSEFLNKDGQVIAERTVYNALKGQSVSIDTLKIIADGLGIPLKCLFDEDGPRVSYYLDVEVESEYENIVNDRKAKQEMEVNALEWYRDLYDIDQRFYPDNIGNIYERFKYEVTTLGELTIYLPLFNFANLLELLNRINADIINREFYVLDKYRDLVNQIPDIPAKQYARYCANKVRLYGKHTLSQEENLLLEEMNDYENSESFNKGYKQYESILKRRKNFFNHDYIRILDENLFPELHAEKNISFSEIMNMLE